MPAAERRSESVYYRLHKARMKGQRFSHPYIHKNLGYADQCTSTDPQMKKEDGRSVLFSAFLATLAGPPGVMGSLPAGIPDEQKVFQRR